MVRCHDCDRIIWPWTRDITSWGPINHTRRTAEFIAHGKCVVERARKRHAEPHVRMATCGLLECTNNIEEEEND